MALGRLGAAGTWPQAAALGLRAANAALRRGGGVGQRGLLTSHSPRQLGLARFHSVCILGFNSLEWFLADIGAIFAG